MNAEQKEQVRAVIREDATGTGELTGIRDGARVYCVLGGLAHALGVLDRQMVGGAGRYGFTKATWLRVLAEYGLTPEQVEELVSINDKWGIGSVDERLASRREGLIACVDKQPTEAA